MQAPITRFFVLWSLLTYLSIPVITSQSVMPSIVHDILAEKWHPIKSTAYSNPINIINRSQKEFKFNESVDPQLSQGEPYLSINPNNQDHLVASFMSLEGVLDFPIYYSFDGGLKWEKSSFDTKEVFGNDFPNAIIAGGGDPLFAFDHNGNLYFSWIYFGFIGVEGTIITYWATSFDGGITFNIGENQHHILEQGTIDVLTGEITGEGDGVFDRPWLAVDRSNGPYQGTLYSLGLFLPSVDSELEEEGIVLRKKLPEIDSFEQNQLQISDSLAQFANIIVDQSGAIHMSYIELDEDLLYYANSIDGGNSINFKTAVVIVDGGVDGTIVHSRENPAPSLAVCPVSNNLYLTWSTFEGDSTVNGFFIKSENEGLDWSEPISIKIISEEKESQVLMPSVMVNAQGEIVLHWYGLDSLNAGFYKMAFSDDQGDSFKNKVDISADTTFFQEYSALNFFGDYFRSDYGNKYAHFIWSDGRNSEGAKVYYRRIDPKDPSVSNGHITPINDQLSISHIFRDQGQYAVNIDSEISVHIKATIVNILGQPIHSWKFDSFPGKTKVFLPNSQMLPGHYFAVFQSKEGQFTRPFQTK